MSTRALEWLLAIEGHRARLGGVLPRTAFDPAWVRHQANLPEDELLARLVCERTMWTIDPSPYACARCLLLERGAVKPPVVSLMKSMGESDEVEAAALAAWSQVRSEGWLPESAQEDWLLLCAALLRPPAGAAQPRPALADWLLLPAAQQQQLHFLWEPASFRDDPRYSRWPSYAIYLSRDGSGVVNPWRLFDGAAYLLGLGERAEIAKPMVHWLRFGLAEARPPNPSMVGVTQARRLAPHEIRAAGDEMRFYSALCGFRPIQHRPGEGHVETMLTAGNIRRESVKRAFRPSTLARMRSLSDELRSIGAVQPPTASADVEVEHGHRAGRSLEPVVSVVVPCYRQGYFLVDMLESVARSCQQPHEVIVVDDCSIVNGVPERLDPVGEHQAVFVLRHRQNHGLGQTRATGVKHSSAHLIQFLDSDDLLLPGQLDRSIELAMQTRADVVLGEYFVCDETASTFFRPDTVNVSAHDFISVASEWEHRLSIPIHCGLFSAKALRETRFDSGLRSKEDWDFWLRLLLPRPLVLYRDEPVAVYRMHSQAMTKRGIVRSAVNYAEVLRRASDLIRSSGAGDDNLILAKQVRHFNAFYSDRLWDQLGESWENLMVASALGDRTQRDA